MQDEKEKTYRLSMSEIKRLQGVDHEVGKLRVRNKELEDGMIKLKCQCDDACRKAYNALAEAHRIIDAAQQELGGQWGKGPSGEPEQRIPR